MDLYKNAFWILLLLDILILTAGSIYYRIDKGSEPTFMVLLLISIVLTGCAALGWILDTI